MWTSPPAVQRVSRSSSVRALRSRRQLGRTGGGGIHLFFRYPRGTEIRNSAGLLGPGLDVRGEGGYVVVPPSHTQGSYEWVDSSPLAEASWLLERLTEGDEATLF
jgi:hypothetical protein